MKKPLLIAGGIAGLIILAVVVLVAVQLIRSDDPDLATEAPPISTQTPQADAASPEPSDDAPVTNDMDLPEGVRRFVIVSEQSSAKYVVEETLRGLVTNAVGTTSDITGEIYLTEEGLWDGAESSFRVDLSTLQSDEGRRDSYIRDNTLQTDQYQYATYVIDSIDAFPAGYVEGEQVELNLNGTLTIRDIPQPVSFTVLARQAGSTLTATADADFKMSDFGISPPSVTIATARDPVHIQVVLIAEEPS